MCARGGVSDDAVEEKRTGFQSTHSTHRNTHTSTHPAPPTPSTLPTPAPTRNAILPERPPLPHLVSRLPEHAVLPPRPPRGHPHKLLHQRLRFTPIRRWVAHRLLRRRLVWVAVRIPISLVCNGGSRVTRMQEANKRVGGQRARGHSEGERGAVVVVVGGGQYPRGGICRGQPRGAKETGVTQTYSTVLRP